MVRNFLAGVTAIIGLAALYLIWTPAKASRPAPVPATAPTLKIASTNDALSFARLGKQTIAVSSYTNGRVTGLPIGNSGEDAIRLVNRLGYDGVRALIAAGGTPITANVADLAVPIDLRDQHIAAGTNYREHAEEATADIRTGTRPIISYLLSPLQTTVAQAGRER